MVAPQRTAIEVNSPIPEILEYIRNQGAKIGVVYGQFEIIHPGAVHMLRMAAETCDFLIVAIWNDRYIREHHGREPFFSETERAVTVGFFKMVNLVVSYHQEELGNLINAIRPDRIYVQEGNPVYIDKDNFDKISVVPTVLTESGEDHSTSHTIYHIREQCFYREEGFWCFNGGGSGHPIVRCEDFAGLVCAVRKNYHLEV